jgi:hypothetical protein
LLTTQRVVPAAEQELDEAAAEIGLTLRHILRVARRLRFWLLLVRLRKRLNFGTVSRRRHRQAMQIGLQRRRLSGSGNRRDAEGERNQTNSSLLRARAGFFAAYKRIDRTHTPRQLCFSVA